MKKVIFKAHIHEPTGWGIVGRKMASALSEQYDLSIETINFQQQQSEPWINEYQNKFTDADVIIHHVLGDKIKRRAGMKNIGYILVETENISRSNWPDFLNTMDEVWVPNTSAEEDLRKNTNIDVPIHAVPYPVDLDVYKTPMKLGFNDSINGLYKFYTIAENIPRKNLFDLIACFHIEFDPQEPVALIIKTNQDIEEDCTNVKQKIALYPKIDDYKPEIFIHKHLTEQSLYGIHNMCDCFVTTSFGEAWCLPMIDAVGFGNIAIGPDYGGPKDILPNDCQFKTTSRFCVDNVHFGHRYQNGFDSWRMPHTDDIRRLMREAYNGQLNVGNLDNFSKESFLSLVERRLK